MKKLTTITLAIIGALFASSCHDKDSTPPKENPLSGFITTENLAATDTAVNEGAYEFGLKFIPKVNGSITALVVNLPDTAAKLRVILWDVSTKQVLRTEYVSIPVKNKEVTKAISSIALTANTEYFITFLSDDWFDRMKADNSNLAYPVTIGNISITGYGYAENSDPSTQVYPTSFPTDYYAGDLSFEFQKSN